MKNLEARIQVMIMNFQHAGRTDVSALTRDILNAAAVKDMIDALFASENEYENLEDRAPMDSGCIECTAGTVPYDRDTGLCAHHLRRAVLAKVSAP